jgi:hypothetical protein
VQHRKLLEMRILLGHGDMLPSGRDFIIKTPVFFESLELFEDQAEIA